MSISKLRIGKDITIKMSILTNGEPVSLDGRDISVVLKTPMCQEVKLNFTIEDNIIISKYEGTKQKYCGIYMLTVWENYGKIGQSALDFCNAFELVSNTCKEVPTSEGLEIETITLEGDLSIGIQGASAYEVAVANGFKGTETEWLEWLKLHYNDLTAEEKAELQKPITDIAADVAEAERQRQQAEEIRRSAEVRRTGEEEKRVTAEDGRKTAEDARVTAETERVSAEVLRGEAEVLRVEAEKNRVSAEVIRAEAETSRVTAESKRSEAEAQRMTGEDLRKVAEQNRTTAEQARVSAEAERVKAESARVTAEQQRAEAERARTEAETQRAAAEQQRAEAEQSRVTAEANRQQQTAAAIEAAKTATASATSATAEAEKAVTAATNATTEASEAAKLATDAASKTSTVDYAVCTTAATTATKEINIAGFALGTHCRFLVKMSHIAETEDVKLSVRSGDTLTEPKPLTFNGAPASVNNTWRAGDILDIYYDGSSFHATHYMGGYGITEINVSEMCPKGGHNGTNKYTLAEAIKKIPETHQRVGFKCSFINDNGEIETAVYQGGMWTDVKKWKVAEDKEKLFPTRITGFLGNCASIPYTERYNVKNEEWISIVWDFPKSFNSPYFLRFYIDDTNKFMLWKNGNQTQVSIASKNKWHTMTIGPQDAALQSSWDAISINLAQKKYIAFTLGEKVGEGSFRETTNPFDVNNIRDDYKEIHIGYNVTAGMTFIGVLNYKLTEEFAERLYNNGLNHNNPISEKDLAYRFGWDKTDWISKEVTNRGDSYLIEGESITVKFNTVDNNAYITCKPILSTLGKYTEFYFEISVKSTAITLCGCGANGRVRMDVFRKDTGEQVGFHASGDIKLEVGEYYAHRVCCISNENTTGYLIQYQHSDTGEVTFSNFKTKRNGYVLSVSASNIANGMCKINADTIAPFKGQYITEELYPKITNESSALFVGQLRYAEAEQSMYVCVDVQKNLWKKITP